MNLLISSTLTFKTTGYKTSIDRSLENPEELKVQALDTKADDNTIIIGERVREDLDIAADEKQPINTVEE